MFQRIPRSLSCGVLLAVAACSPPSVFAEREGPEVTLTAADSEAQFEVTLCIDVPDTIDSVHDPRIEIQADIEVVSSERGGVVRGLVDGTMDEERRDEADLSAPARENYSGEADDFLSFGMDGFEPLEGAGRHCSEPQRMRFEYDGEDPMTQLRLTWTVMVDARYSSNRVLRSDGFTGDDVSIEIEAVE